MAALDPSVAAGRNLVRNVLADLGPGSRVVVAVSGGADSLALAAVTAFVADRASWDLRAVIVDHQLQTGSADVAANAAKQLAERGVDVDVVEVEVRRAGGPEAAARSARYAVLEAQDTDAVLLAHTLDDQAETVLLGLGRGSGPRSIAGMAEVNGLFRRPFLALRRSDTEQICVASGLTWWVDPHNSDPAFRRVRIRSEALLRRWRERQTRCEPTAHTSTTLRVRSTNHWPCKLSRRSRPLFGPGCSDEPRWPRAQILPR